MLRVFLVLAGITLVQGHLYRYFVSSDRQSWLGASRYCRSHGGDLVSIESAEAEKDLKAFLQRHGRKTYWIGLNDRANENKFLWSDGKKVSYTNWERRQPDNYNNEDCVTMQSSWLWNDDRCDKFFNYICKFAVRDYYYYVSDIHKTWDDARKDCRKRGGDLASLHNHLETEYLKHLTTTTSARSYYWIGLNDKANENVYKWSDGTPFSYKNWQKNEPNNNGNEDCVSAEVFHNFQWNDKKCDAKEYFICKIPVRSRVSYSIINHAMTWNKARQKCQSRKNSDLLSIDDKEEQAYVEWLLKNMASQQYWIGFNDQKVEGMFAWSDGSKNLFYNWQKGEPNNNGDEDCVSMYASNSYKWNDNNCFKQLPFICRAQARTRSKCDLGTANCDPNAKCVGTKVGHICYCKSGYYGDGYTCSSGSACWAGRCHKDAKCVSQTSLGKNCQCNPGFYGDGYQCKACQSTVRISTGSRIALPPGYPLQSTNDANACSTKVYSQSAATGISFKDFHLDCDDKLLVTDGSRQAFTWPPVSGGRQACTNPQKPQVGRLYSKVITITLTTKSKVGTGKGVTMEFHSGWKFWLCQCFETSLTQTSAFNADKCFTRDQRLIFPKPPNQSTLHSCLLPKAHYQANCFGVRMHYVTSLFINDLRQNQNARPTSCNGEMNRDVTLLWMYFHTDFKNVGCQSDKADGHLTILLSKIMENKFDLIAHGVRGMDCFRSPDYWFKAYGKSRMKGLYKEASRICDNINDKIACQLVALGEILTLIEDLRNSFRFLPYQKFKLFSDAIKLNLLIHFPKERKFTDYGTTFTYKGLSHVGYVDLIIRNLDHIVNMVELKNLAQLKEYIKYLPSFESLAYLGSCAGKVKDWQCMMKFTVEQFHIYVQKIDNGNRKSKKGGVRHVLHSGIDYKKLIASSRNQEILRLVQKQTPNSLVLADLLKHEFQKAIHNRFKQLRDYFRTVESFNRELSKADISFFETMLQRYKDQSRRLAKQSGEQLAKLLDYAVLISGGDVAESTLELGWAIAEACNPLKTLFAGGTATDILEATSRLSNSIAKVAKAATLKIKLETLFGKTKEMAAKFLNNREFLMVVNELVKFAATSQTQSDLFQKLKHKFLAQNSAYDPKVDRPDLGVMINYWEAVLEEACKVIDEGTGTVAGGIKAMVYSKGYCWRTKIVVKKMIDTYLEIFDFQFSLLDSLASYMGALTAIDASKGMAKDYDNLDNPNINVNKQKALNELKFMSAYTYITYYIQEWNNVEEYCTILEYEEGGVRPSLCQGPQTSIPNLLSRFGKTCHDSSTGFVDIPTKPKYKGDTGFLNFTELYQGKPVIFQIPSTQWLLDNHWITALDLNAVMYVKKFELYLPISSTNKINIAVRAQEIGNNILKPNGKNYIITPLKTLLWEYQEGGYIPCHPTSMDNPYTLCPDKQLPKLCPKSVSRLVRGQLEASVLAKWRISVHGYERSVIKAPTTDILLRAKLKLCKFPSSSSGLGYSAYDARRIKCCGQRQYWSVRFNRCQTCPAGSSSMLNGYYCA